MLKVPLSRKGGVLMYVNQGEKELKKEYVPFLPAQMQENTEERRVRPAKRKSRFLKFLHQLTR